jgi:hypothetical protein
LARLATNKTSRELRDMSEREIGTGVSGKDDGVNGRLTTIARVLERRDERILLQFKDLSLPATAEPIALFLLQLPLPSNINVDSPATCQTRMGWRHIFGRHKCSRAHKSLKGLATTPSTLINA